MNSRISNIFFILSHFEKTKDKIWEKRLENGILFFYYFHFSIIFRIIIIFLSSFGRYVAIHFISIYLRQYSFIETSLFNFPIFYKIRKKRNNWNFSSLFMEQRPFCHWNFHYPVGFTCSTPAAVPLLGLVVLCWAPLLRLDEQDMTMIPLVAQPIVLRHREMARTSTPSLPSIQAEFN